MVFVGVKQCHHRLTESNRKGERSRCVEARVHSRRRTRIAECCTFGSGCDNEFQQTVEKSLVSGHSEDGRYGEAEPLPHPVSLNMMFLWFTQCRVWPEADLVSVTFPTYSMDIQF